MHHSSWLKPHENTDYYNYRHKIHDALFVLQENSKPQREWNEELQAVYDLKIPNSIENLQKEKLLASLYNSFKESAVEGAKLIVEKQLFPVSFFETPNKGLYIYDNIFLTILEDSFLDFKTFNNVNNTQTYQGANLDIKHLNYINQNVQEFGINNFYFSLTCNVHYKGYRIQAQVIIPGIIFNSEIMVEYGQIDEGNIKYNETFYEEIKKFYAKLRIQENVIVDKDGVEFKFAGHPEVKGVRGVDKRKYLFDLIHVFPRDANYLGADNLGCILRPELIKNYKNKMIDENIKGKYAEAFNTMNKDLDEITKNYKNAENYKKSLEELLLKRADLFNKVNEEVSDSLTFNTCIYTNVKFADSEKEKIEKDEQLLVDLAKYLKSNAIDDFLSGIQREEEHLPCDSKTLSTSIHKFGINTRYYGEILKRIESTPESAKTNCWIKSLISRDILVRSAKHIYDNLLKDIPQYLSLIFTSHFLNMFLAPHQLVKLLDHFDISYKNGSLTLTSSTQSTSTTSTTTTTKEEKKK
jgi:protein TIF31